MMMQATHKKRADRSFRQTRGVHADASFAPAFPARAVQPTHRLANRPIDGLIIQPLQETIQRSEVGHTGQAERLTLFSMFAEPHLGFAKSPVLVAHQTQNRQRLGLCELVLAETAAVAREHRFGDLQGVRAKGGQESDFGHRTSYTTIPKNWRVRIFMVVARM
jgi:hypothetical protein